MPRTGDARSRNVSRLLDNFVSCFQHTSPLQGAQDWSKPGFGKDDQREADIPSRLHELADVGELVKQVGKGRHAER